MGVILDRPEKDYLDEKTEQLMSVKDILLAPVAFVTEFVLFCQTTVIPILIVLFIESPVLITVLFIISYTLFTIPSIIFIIKIARNRGKRTSHYPI